MEFIAFLFFFLLKESDFSINQQPKVRRRPLLSIFRGINMGRNHLATNKEADS
jgi:hypothetical protein